MTETRRYEAYTASRAEHRAWEDEARLATSGIRPVSTRWIEDHPGRRLGRRTLEVEYRPIADIEPVLASTDLAFVTEQLRALQLAAIDTIARAAHPATDAERRRRWELDRMAIDHLIARLQAHRRTLVPRHEEEQIPAG